MLRGRDDRAHRGQAVTWTTRQTETHSWNSLNDEQRARLEGLGLTPRTTPATKGKGAGAFERGITAL
ncbi:hypothetical protein, partial [Streptomyces sp. NPDC058086]|uniref:hypothetical protein n=1 Tax=Streptomyces sp. NPDC058086 TaxID=3346334 RepID=UPI0036E06DBA